MGQPRPLFVYLWYFQTNIVTIFTTNKCVKMSCPSSIQSWNSNPRPLGHEPPPITTRPGLPQPKELNARLTRSILEQKATY